MRRLSFLVILCLLLVEFNAFGQDSMATEGEEADNDQGETLIEEANSEEAKQANEAKEEDELPDVVVSSGFHDQTSDKVFFFDVTFQSIFLYRNDSDFDSTAPHYDEDGQSVGVLGTFLKPRFTLKPLENIQIVYETEVGLNLWSKNDPDQYSLNTPDAFRIAQRELYAEGRFADGYFGFKVGYQFFENPSRLFIGHWIGAASIYSDIGWMKLTLTAAQLPDQSYEGITLDSNNFKRDVFLYGLRADFTFDHWEINFGFYTLHDKQYVDRTQTIFSPSLKISADYDWVQFGLMGDYQSGKKEKGAVDGDEETNAWALQAFADFDAHYLNIHFNQLILSPDDTYNNNKTNNAFYYSGKSRSRTLILSEDEIRDMGHNLDEIISENRGKFYLVRPGYSLTDLTFEKDFALTADESLKIVPALIFGMAFVLENENALCGNRVGIETDVDIELRYKDILSFHLIGGILAPGKAAAALANSFDRSAQNIMYSFMSSLSVDF